LAWFDNSGLLRGIGACSMKLQPECFIILT
jgi:hypothetical protein